MKDNIHEFLQLFDTMPENTAKVDKLFLIFFGVLFIYYICTVDCRKKQTYEEEYVSSNLTRHNCDDCSGTGYIQFYYLNCPCLQNGCNLCRKRCSRCCGGVTY